MTVGEPSDPPGTPGPPSMEGPPAPPPGVASPASYTDQELLDNFPVAKLTKLDELISNPRYKRAKRMSLIDTLYLSIIYFVDGSFRFFLGENWRFYSNTV